MAQFTKHFSVEEARALIPDLKVRFIQIGEMIVKIREHQSGLAEAQLKIARGNGKGPIVTSPSPLIKEIQKHIDSMVAMGIQIKDLERGLIDFPHYLEDRPDHEVFLCFEMCENDIEFWHEIETGYSGREPL